MLIFWSNEVKIDDNKEIARKAGGIEIVLKGMNMHVDDYGSCEVSLLTLFRMTDDNSKTKWINNFYRHCLSSVESQIRAREARGIETVINVIRKHINDRYVCSNGSCVLLNLIRNNCKSIGRNIIFKNVCI